MTLEKLQELDVRDLMILTALGTGKWIDEVAREVGLTGPSVRVRLIKCERLLGVRLTAPHRGPTIHATRIGTAAGLVLMQLKTFNRTVEHARNDKTDAQSDRASTRRIAQSENGEICTPSTGSPMGGPG